MNKMKWNASSLRDALSIARVFRIRMDYLLPASRSEMEQMLNAAIEIEEYELAAKLRDRMAGIGNAPILSLYVKPIRSIDSINVTLRIPTKNDGIQ